MVKRAGGESLAATVYEQLRTAILGGELMPGERLKSAELATQFGVSLSVIRETLNLLGAKDLVRIDRNRGFRVTPVSLEALADLTEARVINEGAALRFSVERGDVTWESDVLAAHHRMASQPMYTPDQSARNDDWARAHLEFHHSLIKACRNAVLLDVCARLSDSAELYRAWSTEGTRALHRDVAGEHQALRDAALAHDADKSVDLFEAHIDRTRQILTEFGFAIGTTDTDTSTPTSRRGQ